MDGSEFFDQYPCVPSCPVFSNSVLFWVLLCVSRDVFSLSVLLRLVLTLLLFCLSIRLFFYVLFVLIFWSKIVLIPYHPVVGMSSCIQHLLADRIFCCFGRSSLSWLDIFLVSLLSPLPSALFPRVVFFFTFWVAFIFTSKHFPAFSPCLFFPCCHRFLICVSSRNSHPGFEFLFVFFKENTVFITD